MTAKHWPVSACLPSPHQASLVAFGNGDNLGHGEADSEGHGDPLGSALLQNVQACCRRRQLDGDVGRPGVETARRVQHRSSDLRPWRDSPERRHSPVCPACSCAPAAPGEPHFAPPASSFLTHDVHRAGRLARRAPAPPQ